MGAQFVTPFIRKLVVRNFKSIATCDVELSPLTVLVGRNGSGKSNFLDAIHFVADGLQTSLDHAIKARGGIDAVRRRSTGHPRNFAIRVDFTLPNYQLGTYAFEIAARPNGGFAVKDERLEITTANGRSAAKYHREESRVSSASEDVMPPVLEDRLYLVNAAGLPQFRGAYDALLSTGFYNLNPETMKEVQSPDAGDLLHGDGSNIASVVARLTMQQPETLERITSYLRTIVPSIQTVERTSLGPRETLTFCQNVEGAQHPWRFYAASMSDGTLRALGALVAVAQLASDASSIRFAGIEEPETALHPAAAGALMDALREASTRTQVVVTSHSPDLLDQIHVERDTLLVVTFKNGNSRITQADPASRDAIRRHLYTPGDLLRMDQLQPDESDYERQTRLPFIDASPSIA